MSGLRAILVSVDYADLLAVTMAYNRHHYDEVYVVTSTKDEETAKVAVDNGGIVLGTDLFWDNGAAFNKWRALEWGLDRMGREGWLCVMDADVLWPRGVQVNIFGESLRFDHPSGALLLDRGQLMTPLRRMAPWPMGQPIGFVDCQPLPDERLWSMFPVHRNVAEWAGYTQVFHASDPVLGPPPWHETDWESAGSADSFFQQKWPPHLKRRPPWEVLHLGEAGVNWYGRATPYVDGSVPPDAHEKRDRIDRLWRERRERRQRGEDPFAGEKLK